MYRCRPKYNNPLLSLAHISTVERGSAPDSSNELLSQVSKGGGYLLYNYIDNTISNTAAATKIAAEEYI